MVTRVVKEAFSPNVVEEAFSEVRIAPVLRQAAFLCTHKGVRIQAYIRKPIAPREGITPISGLAHRGDECRFSWTGGENPQNKAT